MVDNVCTPPAAVPGAVAHAVVAHGWRPRDDVAEDVAPQAVGPTGPCDWPGLPFFVVLQPALDHRVWHRAREASTPPHFIQVLALLARLAPSTPSADRGQAF